MSLRLDLIVRDYPQGPRWTWRLFSGSRIVSTSGSQLFSRRIDCARGAEVGAGFMGVQERLAYSGGDGGPVYRNTRKGHETATVQVLDERGPR